MKLTILPLGKPFNSYHFVMIRSTLLKHGFNEKLKNESFRYAL